MRLIAVIFVALSFVQPLNALDTTPSADPLIDGPFLITAYSFGGHNLNYVQIANTSDNVVSIDGWKLQTDWITGLWQSVVLSGVIAPGKKITIADKTILPTATFIFAQTSAALDPRLDSIRLVAPLGSGFLGSTVAISIKDSGSPITPRDSSTNPETFYFARNVSTSTGNYLSTFTASASAPTTIESDGLYEPLTSSPLQIVEVYPNALDCSPANDGPLCYDYVKIFNASTSLVDLGQFRIRTGTVSQSSSSSNTTYPGGKLASGEYMSLKLSLSDSGSYVWVEDVYGYKVYADTSLAFPGSSSREGSAWSYNSSYGDWQWTPTPTPGNAANSFGVDGVVNNCEGVKLSEIGANYSPQFIEIYNPTKSSIDISGCQLQTNRSQTTSYTFPSNIKLAANQYLAMAINKTDLLLTKTTAGTVYLLSSDGVSEVDVRSYENLDDNTSFSLVGGTWQQTFTVTPGSENTYQQYPPCEAGYSRNEESGRCNKDPVVATLATCPASQYRNPDTGRCKLISSTTTLAACPEGQYRNPETNRCKAIASTASTLTPCEEGHERNPETNRCRKTATTSGVPSAAFPVEEVADSAKAFTAWWALGGVLFLGLAYAGWEWRYEVSRWLKRVSIKSEQ